MELHEFDADTPDLLEAARGVQNACRAADTPFRPQLTPHRWEMQVRHGWDGTPHRRFLGTVDGRPVATVEIELPQWDNRDLAWFDLYVDPQHRRRGHGAAMLTHASEVADSAGRTKIGASAWDEPGATAFANRHGFEVGSVAAYRVLRVDDRTRDLAREAVAAAAPHAGDYTLERITGRTPDELLPELAAMAATINDAPLDDLDLEDEDYSPERMRAYEEAVLASGFRLHRMLARHRESGELAGHTVVVVDAETPTLGQQHDSTVTRAHRGHRLGLMLKAELACWLFDAEPQVQTIETWNAASNDHMIAVNEALGYELVASALELQRRAPILTPAGTTYDAGSRPPRERRAR